MILVLVSLNLLFPSGPNNKPEIHLDRENQIILCAFDIQKIDQSVFKKLSNGLTLTLVFTIEVDPEEGRTVKERSQISLRYDLWDELILVHQKHFDGQIEHYKVKDMVALQRHLIKHFLKIASMPETPFDLKLKVALFPFSGKEQSETRAWVSNSTKSGDGLFEHIFSSSLSDGLIVQYVWKYQLEQP